MQHCHCLACDRSVDWTQLDRLGHCAACQADRERTWQAMLRRWNETDHTPPEAPPDASRILASETGMLVADEHEMSQVV
jgi:hypothetical protein